MKFVAFERTQQGTGASRRLRKSGKVPGIVFGAGDPAMIELDHNALYFALKKEAFHSTVLEMELTGAVQKVLLRDVQMHPYRAQVLHVDFQRVDDTTRLHKKVPLHFKGEELSSAVKTDHCLVSHVNNEVEVECLATLLPEFIEVDLSGLTKGQSLKASELKVPEGIKVVRHGRLDPVIVAATPPKAEVEAAQTDDAAAASAAAAPAAAPTPAPAKGAAKPAAKTGAAAKKK